MNSCPHEIAYGTKLNKNQAYNSIYIDEEIGCPLCKKPSNLFLPVYSKDVYVALQSPHIFSKNFSLPAFVALLESGSHDLSSLAGLSREAKDTIARQRGLVENLANQAVSDEILFDDNMKEAVDGYDGQVGRFHKLIAGGIAQLLRYTDVYSLANAIKSYSEIYHNLYISLRLMLLMDWTESNEGFVGRRLEQENLQLFTIPPTTNPSTPVPITKFTRIRSSLINILVESRQGGPSFAVANLDELFAKLLVKLVGPANQALPGLRGERISRPRAAVHGLLPAAAVRSAQAALRARFEAGATGL